MSNLLWKSFYFTPAILGAILGLANEAKANEEFKSIETLKSEAEEFIIAQDTTEQDAGILNQLDEYSSEGGNSLSQDQVTSVSQLRDVSPTDWAYEALRSLVERYGCIVGYPDRTFRGNRATSRYEFAAGLNACMQQMERLIESNTAVLREDIETLKRLMKEFEAELAALGARVDNLEGRVAFLEDHQFSTTTKLQGEAIIAVTQDFMDDNQAIMADRVRLVLNTSFTGEDSLKTRLSAGNAGNFQAETKQKFRTPGLPVQSTGSQFAESATLNQTFNLYPGSDNDVQIDWIGYYVPIDLGEDSRISTYVAGFGGIHQDYVPTLSPYFQDFGGGNGALSTFADESPIYKIGGGSGIAFSYELGFLESLLGPSTATVSYLAGGSPNSPDEGQGLFNGDYAMLGQLNFNVSDSFGLGFTYVHGFHKADSPIFGWGAGSGSGVTGTQLANLSTSSLNSFLATQSGIQTSSGNSLIVDMEDKVSNSYGAQMAWRLSDSISFNAFFNYTSAKRIGRGSDDIWTYGGGYAFPDLGKEGSVLGIFAGVQPYNANSKFFISEVDASGDVVNSYETRISNNSIPVHVEAFYKYQVNDNISLTPGVIWISAPHQDSGNSQVIGTLRSTFTF
jgi:hypothetical protein